MLVAIELSLRMNLLISPFAFNTKDAKENSCKKGILANVYIHHKSLHIAVHIVLHSFLNLNYDQNTLILHSLFSISKGVPMYLNYSTKAFYN